MVDWVQAIPTIVGSGLIVFVLQFVVNQQVLIPNIDFRVNETGRIFEIHNVGTTTATKVVLTIEGATTEPAFSSTDFVRNESTKFTKTTPETTWQIQAPRLSPGPASYYMIELETEPEAIYITYDQGSEKWPKPKFYLVNIVITALAALGVGLILFSYLRRRYKRQYYRFRFTVKVAHDMYQVFDELCELPYLTKIYWNDLCSTKKWDVKNEIVGSMLEDGDALLFKEFYSGLVSRDIAVNKILAAPYEKKKAELKKILEQKLETGKVTKPPMSIEEKRNLEEDYEEDVKKVDKEESKDRVDIENKTKTLKVGETYEKLSTNMLLELHEVNNVLRLTAKKCFRKFGWSTYSVFPMDLTKKDSSWLTLGIGLRIAGLCVAATIALGSLIYFLFTR